MTVGGLLKSATLRKLRKDDVMGDSAKRRLKVYEVKISFWEAGTDDDSEWPNQRYTVVAPSAEKASLDAGVLFVEDFGANRRYTIEEVSVSAWLRDMEGTLKA